MKYFILLALASGLHSYTWAQTGDQARDYQAIELLMTTTKALSATDLSCKQSANCRVLKLGSKACGGPSDYLLVSTKNRNYKEVSYLAKRTIVLEAKYNTTYEVMSDCSMRVSPEVACVNQFCVEKQF